MALVNSEILALLDDILLAFESKYNGNINNPEFIGSVRRNHLLQYVGRLLAVCDGCQCCPYDYKDSRLRIKALTGQVSTCYLSPKSSMNNGNQEGEFNQGMAIICGTVWHNPEKSDLQLNAIDADNLPAVNEICNYKGKQFTIQQLATWTLVEQHDDAPHKMHIVVYSTKPFLKKASNNNSPALKTGIKANEIPAIEVKSSDTAFLFVSGSPHKGSDTCPYKIVGTKEPAICDDFENHIDNICRKYHIPYLTPTTATVKRDSNGGTWEERFRGSRR